MSDNRSVEERIKDLRKMAENAPSDYLRQWSLLEVERMEKWNDMRKAEMMRLNQPATKNIQNGMIVKKIELEMCFSDDFKPPEKFDKTLCSGKCPFLWYEPDECSDVFCCVTAVRPSEEECPIKKFFN